MHKSIASDSFTEWARDAEPQIRHALIAAFGPDVGKEAAAEALAVAWQKWSRVLAMDNPVGYVYGIGRNKGRRLSNRRRPVFMPVPVALQPDVEPGLPKALAALPERQRIVVTLLHGYGWTMTEVADVLGTKKTTVQNHSERGLARLRDALGVSQ